MKPGLARQWHGMIASLVAASAAAAVSRPSLFTTPADVERFRSACRDDTGLAAAASALRARAAAVDPARLPPLARDWWDAAKSQPWSETYPLIFHHTFVLPNRWAQAARDCARASLLDIDPELSDRARQILVGLSAYTFEFEHYDVGMNYTLWAVAALEAYDILYETLAPEEQSQIDAFFERFADAVARNDDYWIEHEPGGRLNNHYAWHKLGICAIGLFYGRAELVERALGGPQGFDFMMRHGFTDDGLWLEGSIPYQLTATAPLLMMAHMLSKGDKTRNLLDTPSPDGRTLRQAYDALLGLAYPDRTLPPIGDCYGARRHLAEYGDWEILYAETGDPRYAWLLRDRPARTDRALFAGLPLHAQPAAPAQTSRLWPEHAYAALRSTDGPEYWSGRGWTLFATYGHHPVHAHADKLSITLFADGHLWLPDCEARPAAEHAFSSAIQAGLNRSTLCHNTLLADGRDQQAPEAPLDLVEYRDLPRAKRITIGDPQGLLYPDLRQLRTCVVCDEYVLDFYQARAAASRELCWIVHVDAVPESGAEEGWTPHAFPDAPPWSYLRGPEVAPAPADRFGETLRHGDALLRWDLRTSSPATLIRCGFPRQEAPQPQLVAMRIARIEADHAWFAALYRRGSASSAPLEIEVARDAMETWTVRVRLGGTHREHTVPRI